MAWSVVQSSGMSVNFIATPTQVKVHVGSQRSITVFHIVDIPLDRSREQRNRLQAAIMNSGFKWPVCRITVLVPGVSSVTSRSDLPIAMAVLAASGQFPAFAGLIDTCRFVGRLWLSGNVKGVEGDLWPGTLRIDGQRGINLRYVVEAVSCVVALTSGVVR